MEYFCSRYSTCLCTFFSKQGQSYSRMIRNCIVQKYALRGLSSESPRMEVDIYDVCHNIARVEIILFMEYHALAAFIGRAQQEHSEDDPELTSIFQNWSASTVPGDMGTSSCNGGPGERLQPSIWIIMPWRRQSDVEN